MGEGGPWPIRVGRPLRADSGARVGVSTRSPEPCDRPRGRSGALALTAIWINDVARTFRARRGRLLALDGITLQIPAGQVCAVIGPNGSGKSTLLRVVGGLLEPDRGRILLDGEPVSGADPRIGFVFQEPRLLPWRDTLSNVAFPLEIAGWDESSRSSRAADLIELVGLGGFERARPGQLSGGMRQRAALARALALQPSVLLLDEPFSALDALTRERLNEELLALWDRTGATILLVTHSIPEAVFLADRVVVLSPRPGHVVADIAIPISRPRRIADLDVAAATSLAEEIRKHLREPEDAPPVATGRRDVRAEAPARS